MVEDNQHNGLVRLQLQQLDSQQRSLGQIKRGLRGLLGQLFVGMLKAVAPLLVMLLVMSAIANRHESGNDGRKTLLTLSLYLVGTVSAALVAVVLSAVFPQTLVLTEVAEGAPPVTGYLTLGFKAVAVSAEQTLKLALDASSLVPMIADAAFFTRTTVGATAPRATRADFTIPFESNTSATPALTTAISISVRGMNLRYASPDLGDGLSS